MAQDRTELEDAGAPEAKHAQDANTQGEWERSSQMQDKSDHLRNVLDEARRAADKAHDADSMAAGGLGVEPQEVQEIGSGDAESDADESG